MAKVLPSEDELRSSIGPCWVSPYRDGVVYYPYDRVEKFLLANGFRRKYSVNKMMAECIDKTHSSCEAHARVIHALVYGPDEAQGKNGDA